MPVLGCRGGAHHGQGGVEAEPPGETEDITTPLTWQHEGQSKTDGRVAARSELCVCGFVCALAFAARSSGRGEAIPEATPHETVVGACEYMYSCAFCFMRLTQHNLQADNVV